MLKGDTGAKRTWFYENGAFVAAALAAVLWHVVLSTNVGDDMVYFKTLLDGNSSLGEILAHRYETWSSRMVIEAVLIPLVHCPLLWKILDIVIFTSLPVLLCGLLGVTGRGRWFVTGLVLLYPFADMASAGWIATTTNYLWPLWGVLVIGMVLKQFRCGRKVPVWEVAAALLACAYAGSQEQAAVLLLLLFGMEVLHYISEKCMKQPLLYALCGIDIISLVYILSCPGNAIRSAQEMAGRMPEFADFLHSQRSSTWDLPMWNGSLSRSLIRSIALWQQCLCCLCIVRQTITVRRFWRGFRRCCCLDRRWCASATHP